MSAGVLLAAWWAYRAKILTLLDLRVWLACLELISRRCELHSGRAPRFRIVEIRSLVACHNDVSIRRATRRLVRVGLLTSSGPNLSIPRSTANLSFLADPSITSRMDAAPSIRRIVPVPRRLLRYLASEGRASVIATAFGHLLRCLFYRNGKCESGGRCKSSWIADVFAVDLRTVKSARRDLIDRGWLLVRSATQCELNRWGLPVVINLEWSPGAVAPEHESPPPLRAIAGGSPPPIENKKLSSRVKNHKPATRGPAGVSNENDSPKPPSLRRVKAEDLTEPIRLEELYRLAVRERMISSTPCDRLRFFGAAERAKRVGDRNPSGLFMSLVRRQQWGFITQHDEDRALQAMKHLDDPLGHRPSPGHPGYAGSPRETRHTGITDGRPWLARGGNAVSCS